MDENQNYPSGQENLSYWERDAFLGRCEVLIIGGGLVGLSTALALLDRVPGLPITVVEGGVLPAGASTKNAGFACFGSMTELLGDQRSMAEAEVWEVVRQRWEGLQLLRRRVGDHNLRYNPCGGYELFREEDEAEWIRSRAALDSVNAILLEITGIREVFQVADGRIREQGFAGVRHLLFNRAEGHLHPGYMVRWLQERCISRGVRCYSGCRVEGIHRAENGYRVNTQGGWHFSAETVVVATNGFSRRLLPGLAVLPARNQVLLTEPVPGGLPWTGTFHYQQGYLYFRDVGDRVLLGGARHLDPGGEETDQPGFTPLIQNALEAFLRKTILPGSTVPVAQRWSGTLGIGPVKKPILEAVAPGLIVAARLGGMGVALGSLLGERAAELVLEGHGLHGTGG